MDTSYDFTSIALGIVLLGTALGFGLSQLGRQNMERCRAFSTKEDLLNHLEANEVTSPWGGAAIGVVLIGGVYFLTVGAAALLRAAAVMLTQ